jgi:cyclophilin family peptidyl-prolyl cis-trans isomerase
MPSEKRQRQKEREQAAREARQSEERRKQQRKTWFAIGGLVLLVLAIAAAYSVFAGDEDGDDETTQVATDTSADTDETAAPEDTTTTTIDPALQAECPAEDGSSEQRLEFDAPQQDCLVPGATYEAVFDTTAGEIRVALDTENTPQTANNFIVLSRYHYYDDTEMFRSNTGIDIIQGGSPHTNSSSDPGPGYTIPDEGGPYSYEAGDLVMARTAAPNSASAQYFFSTGPNTQLLNAQGTYVKFGRVTEGLDILEEIMATHVEDDDESTQEGEGVPDPIPVVNSVTIVQS